jgi:hypothetical protein
LKPIAIPENRWRAVETLLCRSGQAVKEKSGFLERCPPAAAGGKQLSENDVDFLAPGISHWNDGLNTKM